MSFLRDVFQTADEIKQSQEKFKDAVDVSNRQAAALIRPYLNEAQNEILSEILEGLVASVAEHSFQIGYNSAIKQYLLATLYNAPVTVDSYYSAQVRHEFGWGSRVDKN